MVRSCVFIFLAVTLCFVFCLCAQATVNKEEAIKAVNNAKQFTANVLKMAEHELKEAENEKLNMEWYEEKAEKRVSEAEEEAEKAKAAAAAAREINTDTFLTAEQKIKAKKALEDAISRKSETENIARNKKYQLLNARSTYPNVKKDTNTAIQTLIDVLSKARELDEKAESEVWPDTDLPIDYTKVSKSALNVKTEAEALEEEIENAKTLLSGAKSILHRMPGPTIGELIEKHKADGIVAGAVFKTIVGETDIIIKSIEEKKDEVSTAVEAISELLKNNPQVSTHPIYGFLAVAQGDLKTISQIVNEVYKAKKTILKTNLHARYSRAKLKMAKDETTAQRHLRFIKYYAESSALELERIKKALKPTEKSVQSANRQKQNAIAEPLEKESSINGEANAATEKPETIVEETEVIPKRQAAEPQTNQKKEEIKDEATEISTGQKVKQRTDQQTGNKVEETTTKPTNKDAVQLIDQQKQEPAEEETATPTNKTPKVPADNKPDQLTEEQIKNKQVTPQKGKQQINQNNLQNSIQNFCKKMQL